MASSPVKSTAVIQPSTRGVFIFTWRLSVPHDFVKLRDKIGKPSSAVVYVAKHFPAWKVAVLKLLRDKHAAGKLTLLKQDEMKTNAVASDQWKDIIKELMQDPELKKFGKHVGPFAAFKRDEAADDGVAALDAAVPFDEMKLMQEHVAFLSAKLSLDVKVCAAESPVDATHGDAASQSQPGKPSVLYAGGAVAAKAQPKAKAGGAGAKEAAQPKAKAEAGAPKKAAAAAGTTGDLAALNSSLSTRSYIEGGHKPTAADAAQFASMQNASVSNEQFPHVARWLKHMKYFTPIQRSKW